MSNEWREEIRALFDKALRNLANAKEASLDPSVKASLDGAAAKLEEIVIPGGDTSAPSE